MKHFRSINSPLLSIETYPDPTTQVHRYKDKVLIDRIAQFSYIYVFTLERKFR